MYTSILLVAMAGIQLPATLSTPDWKSDYTTASRESKKAHKPLAIFVGHGADGWAQISTSSRLGSEVRGLLGKHYVCLYIDDDTAAGRAMVSDLELVPNAPGLVISNSKGDLQAFRYSGTLSPQQLSTQLRTFSDPKRVVTQTVTSVY